MSNYGNKLIADAINLGASDIHIESFRNSATVRFREDGILHIKDKYTKFLRENYNAVVNRIKMMSKLDIAEKRKPQDGGSTFKNDKKEVDLRDIQISGQIQYPEYRMSEYLESLALHETSQNLQRLLDP